MAGNGKSVVRLCSIVPYSQFSWGRWRELHSYFLSAALEPGMDIIPGHVSVCVPGRVHFCVLVKVKYKRGA